MGRPGTSSTTTVSRLKLTSRAMVAPRSRSPSSCESRSTEMSTASTCSTATTTESSSPTPTTTPSPPRCAKRSANSMSGKTSGKWSSKQIPDSAGLAEQTCCSAAKPAGGAEHAILSQRSPRSTGGPVGEGQQGEIKLSVPAYDRSKGVIAPVEGGDVTVELHGDGILIRGSGTGLRDLARWCMALADPDAP